MSSDSTQPFLRWAGSKRQILPQLARYWAAGYRRYVEPFAGSACLFFRLQPELALLGDVNADLVETYRTLRRDVSGVLIALREWERGREVYLALRSLDPMSLQPPQRAARFIYLNRFCFNGLYRTNKAGRFNVPYGGEKAAQLPSDQALEKCSASLRNARLIHGDFADVLSKVCEGDFVYMDPPYRVAGQRVFNEYDPSVFSKQDIERLRSWMELLDAKGVAFVVSYAECDEAVFLQRGFHVETVTVRRNIAGFAAHRGLSNEVLVSNTKPTEQ